MTRARFLEDVRRARVLLEDVAGCPVRGYRSPGFSVIDRTPWFFDALVEAGYGYDSSVFPAARGHGGIPRGRREPHVVAGAGGDLVEFPITVTDLWRKPLCFFGGGYLRVFPYRLIRRMGRRVLAGGRPVIFYVHPREVDPAHPRLPMGWRRRFKTYVNLRGTEAKIARILDDFPIITFADFLNRYFPRGT
jgi:polysaccharide deacetylase family protein (PEP-CTERM system associated)